MDDIFNSFTHELSSYTDKQFKYLKRSLFSLAMLAEHHSPLINTIQIENGVNNGSPLLLVPHHLANILSKYSDCS